MDVGFHSLRHTFVSLTANAGASLGNVRSMTGHATTDMALHYFHENEDGLKKTVAIIPAIVDTSTPAKPAEGEFDAFLNGLRGAACCVIMESWAGAIEFCQNKVYNLL